MPDLTPLPAPHRAAPPRAPEPAPRAALGRKAKAAIVVRLLLNEGADIPLGDLPDDLQARLTQTMGGMGVIDKATLMEVIGEFAQELDGIGLSFPPGIAGALSALDGRLSPQTAARLRKEAGVRQFGDPWARIRSVDLDDLVTLVDAESVEVAAVLLSKLDTAVAAALLGRLPGPQARRIAYAVSLTGAVTPEAVDRIGLSLAAQLDTRPVLAFDDAPEKRVGAILNFSASRTRDDVLSGLDETDADFAQQVRRTIFTFADIPARIAPRDIPKCARAIPQDRLVAALASAVQTGQQAAADFILGAMSSRMADGLREEIAEAGQVSEADGEAAMGELVAAIRTLADSGEITMTLPQED
jgi:flagellar motor switch protein FliG